MEKEMADYDTLYEIAVRETSANLKADLETRQALKLIDKLLAQIDEAYQEWQVDGGDVRDWVGQIEAIRALLSKA